MRLPYIAVLVAWGFVSLGHLLPDLVGDLLRSHLRSVAWVAVVIHTVTLAYGLGYSPYPTGFPEALSGVSLGVGLAYLWVAQHNTRALGMLLAPLAMVALGTAQVVPHRSVSALAETGYSAWLPIHLGLMFAGIAGFALSSVVGVAFLWVRGRLKAKKFSGLARLP